MATILICKDLFYGFGMLRQRIIDLFKWFWSKGKITFQWGEGVGGLNIPINGTSNRSIKYKCSVYI